LSNKHPSKQRQKKTKKQPYIGSSENKSRDRERTRTTLYNFLKGRITLHTTSLSLIPPYQKSRDTDWILFHLSIIEGSRIERWKTGIDLFLYVYASDFFFSITSNLGTSVSWLFETIAILDIKTEVIMRFKRVPQRSFTYY